MDQRKHIAIIFLVEYISSMRLYFASGNEHKKKEMSRLLGGYDLILPKEEGIDFNPDETGNDFISNAVIKAEALYKIVKAPVIADDSGLVVKALGGQPGVHTARYGEKEAGHALTDKEKYLLLLKNMQGKDDRSAVFITALCLILSDERRYIIQESCEGKISSEPSGSNGFGYDPVFFINEAGMISADLPEGEKDRYSHRGKAARLMKLLLEKEDENGKKRTED